MCVVVAPAAVALAAIALLRTGVRGPGVEAIDVARALLVTVWAAAGLVVGLRQRTDRTAPIALGIAGWAASRSQPTR